MNIATFKALLDTLKMETPVNQNILQEQAVNTIGIIKTQRKKFVDLFVTAAEKVGLIMRIDKNTIKRSAQTILETLPVNTADIFSLNNRPIEIAREDNNEKMNAETIFYPYTDNGDGWKLEIKITSAKNLTHEIRSMRSKIGELLEALNHDK